MASLENRNGSYRVIFRLFGRKFSRSLRTRNAKAAHGTFARLEDNLRRVELGSLVIPSGENVPMFLLSDGNSQDLARQPATVTDLPLAVLFDRYSAHIPEGSLENPRQDSLQDQPADPKQESLPDQPEDSHPTNDNPSEPETT